MFHLPLAANMLLIFDNDLPMAAKPHDLQSHTLYLPPLMLLGLAALKPSQIPSVFTPKLILV